MAKVDLGNVAPDAFPRVRGVFLVQPYRGGLAARAWPKKRGDNQHPNSKWTAEQFGYAGRMAANATPLDWQTAAYMTAGTDWVPRDLLMRGIYGKAYEIVLKDGTTYQPADHSPPKPRRPMTQQWQYNQFDNAYNATTTAGAFAWKGNILTPDTQINIAAAQAIFTGVNGGLYRMALATLNGANQIVELEISDQVQVIDTLRKWREFNLEGVMLPGTAYALMVGRQDAGPTYSLPLNQATTPKWLMPITSLGNALLAQTTPAVGQTVTTNSVNTPFLGMLAAY